MLFDRIIRWSLAHRGVVCVGWLVLTVVGIASFLRALSRRDRAADHLASRAGTLRSP